MLISLQLYDFPFLAMTFSLIIIIEYQALLPLSLRIASNCTKRQGSVTASLFVVPALFLLLLSWLRAALQQHCPEERALSAGAMFAQDTASAC